MPKKSRIFLHHHDNTVTVALVDPDQIAGHAIVTFNGKWFVYSGFIEGQLAPHFEEANQPVVIIASDLDPTFGI